MIHVSTTQEISYVSMTARMDRVVVTLLPYLDEPRKAELEYIRSMVYGLKDARTVLPTIHMLELFAMSLRGSVQERDAYAVIRSMIHDLKAIQRGEAILI